MDGSQTAMFNNNLSSHYTLEASVVKLRDISSFFSAIATFSA